jgi:hypothetical protein
MPRCAVNMLIYLIQHDAHHRGQICALARDLGHEFKSEDTMRICSGHSLDATNGSVVCRCTKIRATGGGKK